MLDEKEEEAVWKTYPEYPFIQANQFGEVRITDRVVTDKNGVKYNYRERVLKQEDNGRGYMRVSFGVNCKKVHLYVHRIVATCFLPNPDNLPEVNHKDCNPKNNAVNNLEWCTREYNNAYREKFGKSAAKVFGSPVFAVNLKTEEVLFFESQHEAARQLGVSAANINSVLKGRMKQVKGYWFTEDKKEITKEKIQEVKDNMIFLDGVITVNLKTFKISRFETQREAARQLGVNPGNVQSVLKGHRNQTGGYWFCYADSNAVENARAKFGDKIACEIKKLLSDEL